MTIVIEELHRPGGGPSSGSATVRLIASTTDRSAPGYSGDLTILGTWRERADALGIVAFNLVPNSAIVPAGTVYEIVSGVPGTTAAPRYFTVPAAGPVYVEDVLTELPGSLPTPPLAVETADRIAGDDLLNGRLDVEEAARIAADVTFQPLAEKGQPSGYADLDTAGKVPLTRLPESGDLRARGTTVGQSSMVSGAVVLDYVTDWGISSGTPYYAPGAVVAGEEAVLTLDDITGAVVIVPVNPPGAVPHDEDPLAHPGAFLTLATADASYVPRGSSKPSYRQAGRFFSGDGVTFANTILAEGDLTLTQIEIDRALTIDQLMCNVNTAGTAGAVLRYVVYDSVNVYPNVVVAEVVRDATATGSLVGSLVPPVVLPAGTYFIGAAIQGGATTRPQTTCITNGGRSLSQVGGFGVGNISSGYRASGVTGAAPSPFPTGEVPTGSVHRVYARVAA